MKEGDCGVLNGEKDSVVYWREGDYVVHWCMRGALWLLERETL